MNEQTLRLHEESKHFPRISPIYLMRKTKQSFEYCVDLCARINLLRDRDGCNRKKWARIK